ncbi:MAG: alpha/beta hydrolase [Planctomycetota bacterium]|nr:alpha/beta hydrolase [Planctomycetota bacterium]
MKPRSRPRRTLASMLRLALIAYGCWCALLWMMQRSMLYLAIAAGTPMPDALLATSIQRFNVGETGQTAAWLLRPEQPGSFPLAVFFHGNAELIDHCLEDARSWQARGYAVLMCEYRGYGRSGGSPSQQALVDDALEALAIASAQADIDVSRLVLHGRSLGTGVAAQVAAALATPPSLIVLESPFVSVASFSWRYGVPPLLVRDTYRTDEALLGLRDVPVLIVHGRDDEVVGFAHGVALHALLPTSTLVELHGAGHGALSVLPEYGAAIDVAVRDVDWGRTK